MAECGNPEELLDFPCQYTFKAVGQGDVSFRDQIVAVARRHAPVPEDAILVRPSAKGKYQSVSILVRLDNYQQLKDIYAAMKEVDGLKMLL